MTKETTQENENTGSNMIESLASNLIKQGISKFFSNFSLSSVTGIFSSIFKAVQDFVTEIASFFSDLVNKLSLGFSLFKDKLFGTKENSEEKPLMTEFADAAKDHALGIVTDAVTGMFFAKPDTKSTEARPSWLCNTLKSFGKAAISSFTEAFEAEKAENKSASRGA